ncbi:MAG TPA: TetR/AcrR family transcriptional regulator [Acidimicrobiales bacterium]|nr:TetR/AcrR family transcriptional regulator [Acidimicrobiales bacterium]
MQAASNRGFMGPNQSSTQAVLPGSGKHPVDEHTDPRVLRTAQACEEAIVELASEKPISQITVADLAERAKVTRATFYNHYATPLELLIQVLLADLERAHLQEQERRSGGSLSAAEMLRLSIADVADHIERFKAVYQHAVHNPADGGVYEALVRHFTDYARVFIARCTHPDLPDKNHHVIAQFVAHGFAGAIKAWLSDTSVTKEALIDAAVASAPVWWS